MKSVFRSLAAIALMACALFVDTCAMVAAPIVAVARKVKQVVVEFMSGGLALAARCRDLNPVAILLPRLESYWLRIARRQRPVVTGGWRSCPSV